MDAYLAGQRLKTSKHMLGGETVFAKTGLTGWPVPSIPTILKNGTYAGGALQRSISAPPGAGPACLRKKVAFCGILWYNDRRCSAAGGGRLKITSIQLKAVGNTAKSSRETASLSGYSSGFGRSTGRKQRLRKNEVIKAAGEAHIRSPFRRGNSRIRA